MTLQLSNFPHDYVWPDDDLTVIPDWVYTDQAIYEREVERIFHGPTWNYVALEAEIPNAGDFIRSNVGPTPVVVARAADGSIHVFENRCAHRAAEFCRELSGTAKEFVCPYHQWTYDLKGNLIGVPFRRGVGRQGRHAGGLQAWQDHGLRKLNVTTHRGVVFASYRDDMESFADYLGPEVLREFEATFDGRKLKRARPLPAFAAGQLEALSRESQGPLSRHAAAHLPGDLRPAGRRQPLADAGRQERPARRDGVGEVGRQGAVGRRQEGDAQPTRKGMTLREPRFMDFIEEFDSPWSVTMATIWPNLIVQREMNTLGIRQIVPTGPHEFIMKWTMFGFEGDDEEMTRHRLRQGNLMGPAGFLGPRGQRGDQIRPGRHAARAERQASGQARSGDETGTADTLISEAAIRAMYKHWREAMGL